LGIKKRSTFLPLPFEPFLPLSIKKKEKKREDNIMEWN